MVALSRRVIWIVAVIMAASVLFQVWQVWRFVNQGARFTADDGRALCERVKALEALSYGYRDSGKPSADCRYEER